MSLGAFAFEYEIEMEDEAKAYDTLEENGMQVYHLTDEERQEWVDYARTTYPSSQNSSVRTPLI